MLRPIKEETVDN